MRKASIFVETPFQLLCGYEAYLRVNGDAHFYVRLTGRGRNDEQMSNMVEIMGLAVVFFKLEPRRLFIDIPRNIPLLMRLFISRPKIVYVGSWFSRGLRLLAKVARPEERVFLDDGVATLLAQEMMKEKGRDENLFTFFSIPALPNQSVHRHAFEEVLKIFPTKEVSSNYFVGQPLVERGYMVEREYLDCIERAASLCEKEDILYIPHRVEDPGIFQRIRKIKRVKIAQINECVELYFLKKGSFPQKFFGLSSTSLITIASLSSATNVYSFGVENERYNAIPHLKKIYDQLSLYKNAMLFGNSSGGNGI